MRLSNDAVGCCHLSRITSSVQGTLSYCVLFYEPSLFQPLVHAYIHSPYRQTWKFDFSRVDARYRFRTVLWDDPNTDTTSTVGCAVENLPVVR
jgi:hypothetical protein